MNNPCVKDCPRRSPACHGSCEKYAAFAEERRQIYDKPHLPLLDRELIMTEGRRLIRENAILKRKFRKHR